MDIKTINDYLNKHQYKELFNKANATFEEAEGNDNSLKMKEASEYIEAYRILDLHHPVLSTKAVYNSCAESGDDLIIFTN